MILEKRIPPRYWVGLVQTDAILVAVFSVGVYLLSRSYIEEDLPVSIAGFLGTSIALLLSFKLSQSYDRWWEARKVWGAMVNDSRSLVVQVANYGGHRQIAKEMAKRQVQFCRSLTRTLRGEKHAKHESQDSMEQESAAIHHLALSLLNKHAVDLEKLHRDGVLTDYQQMQIDKTLVRICENMGKLERIKKTVFPKTYRMTLRLFIHLFLIILSISLSNLDYWIALPVIFSLTIPFFLLEKIAFNIQNPFENKPTDIPMNAICDTIEKNLMELVGEKTTDSQPDSNGYYIL